MAPHIARSARLAVVRWTTAGYESGTWVNGAYDEAEVTAGYHLARALGRFRDVSRVADLALTIACDESIHLRIRQNANGSLPVEKIMHELRPHMGGGVPARPEQC